MSELVVDGAVLLDKIRAVLRAEGRRCEITDPPAPPTGEKNPKAPYTIIDAIENGSWQDTVTLDGPDACAVLMVQLTHVARNGYDASRQADECRRILLGRSDGTYTTDLDSAQQKVGGRSTMGPGMADRGGILVSLPERYEFLVSL